MIANSIKVSLKFSLIACLLTLLSGCPANIFDDDDDDYIYKPVYLSYSDLRRSIQVQETRPIQRVSRVYLYENYFFLNEKNYGIHVFDNTDSSNPVNTAYINIPGNTELSIKEGYLYADSYVDLVTLDINNMADITVTTRVENIFPWDAYQNVDDSVYFSFDQLDESRGVITGYE